MNKPIKILIVEDELLIAKSLSHKLKKLGYEILEIVASGKIAIESVELLKPDLVLMDIVIEGEMDGIETASKIHEFFKIPVVYTTAYADDETLQRAEQSGSYGYVLKPFKERDLHATIKIALSKHKEAMKTQESLAKSEAESADKSRYLSMASHDLRTPLTTIQLSATMLKMYDRKWDDSKKSKHFSRIQDAIANMNNLLEDILIISKAEAGKLTFNPDLIDVMKLCQNLLEELKSISNEKHSLNCKFSGEFQLVKLDEKLLYYILANLISNAIKYSPDGGPVTLEVSCNPQQIIFSVQDEGIGIPPEYRTKLFQLFERAANVGNIKGTGLGLSIVKQAVALHGGEITVESEIGKGSKFTVTIPLNSGSF